MQTRQVKKEAVDASLQLHIILYWSPLHIYYQNNPHRSWCSPSVRPLAVMLFLFCCILETEAVSHSWSVWTELLNYVTIYVAHF